MKLLGNGIWCAAFDPPACHGLLSYAFGRLRAARCIAVLAAVMVLVPFGQGIQAAPTKTAGFVDITVESPADSSYPDIIRALISEQLKAMDITYIPPHLYEGFQDTEKEYVFHFQAKVELFSALTRVEFRLVNQAEKTELFRKSVHWEYSTGHRALQDADKITNEFQREISPLYTIAFKHYDGRRTIFADCILPHRQDEYAWDLSRYVTTNYPKILRQSASVSNMGVRGIDPQHFDNWCKSNVRRRFPPTMFQLQIEGRLYQFKSGIELQLYFSRDADSEVVMVQFPRQAKDAPKVILEAVKTFMRKN